MILRHIIYVLNDNRLEKQKWIWIAFCVLKSAMLIQSKNKEFYA
jgi:hypothetical protein